MAVALGRGVGVEAQTLTQEEALRVAFPDADRVERRTAYLDDTQLQRAAALAGREVEMESGVVTYYVAIEGGAPMGVAYFDAHRVRTLPEVLMIVVDVENRIRRLDILRFAEPPEYRAPLGWLARFLGRELDDDLSPRRGIAAITGATLTTRAVTGSARRILALHNVIEPLRVGSE
jgi:hypothetical protein